MTNKLTTLEDFFDNAEVPKKERQSYLVILKEFYKTGFDVYKYARKFKVNKDADIPKSRYDVPMIESFGTEDVDIVYLENSSSGIIDESKIDFENELIRQNECYRELTEPLPYFIQLNEGRVERILRRNPRYVEVVDVFAGGNPWSGPRMISRFSRWDIEIMDFNERSVLVRTKSTNDFRWSKYKILEYATKPINDDLTEEIKIISQIQKGLEDKSLIGATTNERFNENNSLIGEDTSNVFCFRKGKGYVFAMPYLVVGREITGYLQGKVYADWVINKNDFLKTPMVLFQK